MMHEPPIAKQPPVRLTPPAKVEVAELSETRLRTVVVPRYASTAEARTAPPVTESPFDDERPAVDTPPANVEVPVPITAKFVVVALVVVPASAVKVWSVDEPVARRLTVVRSPPIDALFVTVSAVPAAEKVLVPEKTWPVRFKSATFEES